MSDESSIVYWAVYKCMSTMVRVQEDTHERLKKLRREGESLDEVISRLIEGREKDIEEGAGFWEGTDAGEGAREARRSMKEEVGIDSD